MTYVFIITDGLPTIRLLARVPAIIRGATVWCAPFRGQEIWPEGQHLAKNRYRPGLATYVAGATAATGGINRRNLGKPADGQQAEIHEIAASTLRTR